MAKKELFLVIGVAQSGSGSLTWPEDFDIVGVFESEERALARAKEMNPKDMPDPDSEEYDEYGTDSDETIYEVHPVSSFSKGKR